MPIQYYVCGADWISQLSSLIQKTNLCPTKSFSWQLDFIYSDSLSVSVELISQSRKTPTRYALPVAPLSLETNAWHWHTRSVIHGNWQQWSVCIISNKATLDSLQAAKQKWEPTSGSSLVLLVTMKQRCNLKQKDVCWCAYITLACSRWSKVDYVALCLYECQTGRLNIQNNVFAAGTVRYCLKRVGVLFFLKASIK